MPLSRLNGICIFGAWCALAGFAHMQMRSTFLKGVASSPYANDPQLFVSPGECRPETGPGGRNFLSQVSIASPSITDPTLGSEGGNSCSFPDMGGAVMSSLQMDD